PRSEPLRSRAISSCLVEAFKVLDQTTRKKRELTAEICSGGCHAQSKRIFEICGDRIGRRRLRRLRHQTCDSSTGQRPRAARDLARRMFDVQSEKLAEMCKAIPGRFLGYAPVSLQFPELAAEQLEHGMNRLGLVGAAIGGSVEGEEIAASKFDPFWKKAEELQTLVFIHPQTAPQSTGITKRIQGSGALGNVIGNPLETSLALAHLIFEGTLDRFPNVKICGAHGGGFLPSYAARMDPGCSVFPDQCKGLTLKK